MLFFSDESAIAKADRSNRSIEVANINYESSSSVRNRSESIDSDSHIPDEIENSDEFDQFQNAVGKTDSVSCSAVDYRRKKTSTTASFSAATMLGPNGEHIKHIGGIITHTIICARLPLLKSEKNNYYSWFFTGTNVIMRRQKSSVAITPTANVPTQMFSTMASSSPNDIEDRPKRRISYLRATANDNSMQVLESSDIGVSKNRKSLNLPVTTTSTETDDVLLPISQSRILDFTDPQTIAQQLKRYLHIFYSSSNTNILEIWGCRMKIVFRWDF